MAFAITGYTLSCGDSFRLGEFLPLTKRPKDPRVHHHHPEATSLRIVLRSLVMFGWCRRSRQSISCFDLAILQTPFRFYRKSFLYFHAITIDPPVSSLCFHLSTRLYQRDDADYAGKKKSFGRRGRYLLWCGQNPFKNQVPLANPRPRITTYALVVRSVLSAPSRRSRPSESRFSLCLRLASPVLTKPPVAMRRVDLPVMYLNPPCFKNIHFNPRGQARPRIQQLSPNSQFPLAVRGSCEPNRFRSRKQKEKRTRRRY